ncbi:TspO/MBR family protein [Paenibacillus aceris]|uniref:Tryptophan-rich sensory protein n=1 Tax=Paenibacillus aceris TaxID=869555 RepID=A0ABS4HT14_9BACL|nr:TspO/MBR family protein [Paenibacillus aceris]MBP1961771.1 tryptophan-rich sensory protein [Paenibacillus aceris]NHW34372.1 tryptophan-rich sensory protein [Paenibacillus aceris]
MLTFIFAFLITYALFSISGVLFPADLSYYASLKKPNWQPPAKLFGIVWGIMYALISASVAIVYTKTDGFQEAAISYVLILLINYIVNQTFTIFEFKLKNLQLAFVDTAVVAITTCLLIQATIPYSKFAAWLLVPYLLWSCFATLLSWTIFQLNKKSNYAS